MMNPSVFDRHAAAISVGTLQRVFAQAVDAGLHDLSQPVTAVICALELLRYDNLDPAQSASMLLAAEAQCHRMVQVIGSLRDLLAQVVDGSQSSGDLNKKGVA